MKVVVAIDSLKGCLTSMEAGEAIRKGVLNACGDAQVVVRPLADGGEGTTDALIFGMGGRTETVTVTGPLGKPVTCSYGIVEDTKTAVIEMSGAAGITLVPDAEKNPLNTTTYGVGEVIKDAIQKGCRRFIVGIGGSATNDGGVGMLQALGFGFLDQNDNPITYGAKGLKDLVTIKDDHVLPELKDCTFRVACDVTNTLCGPQGCSSIFGPQKGATSESIMEMDAWLSAYAKKAAAKYPHADAMFPGTGAAGGMGFAFLTFTNAALESGIQIVLEETRLEEYVKGADYVITGEGRLDRQTMMGKAPSGIASIAKKYNIPVIAFAGSVSEDAKECNEKGIDAYFPILRSVVTLSEAMDKDTASRNMTNTVEQVFRLIKAVR
jgi:glycerate kinase